MIKNALNNFFKNLIYLFVPMGIVYLFFLVALFVAIGSVVNIAGSAFSQAFALVRDSVGESSASVNEFLNYAFGQLRWNGNLIEMVVNAFRTRWLSNTVRGFFETLNVSSEGFSEQFNVIMGDFTVKLRAVISGVAVLCVTGVIVASYLTRLVLRKRTAAKRGLKKILVAHTLVPLVQAVFLIASLVLLAVIGYYGLLVIALLLLVSCAFSLTSSWLIHRNGALRLKDVVTWKNILLHLGAIGVILLINVALAVVLFVIDPLLAVLIMIPLALYSLGIVGTNTDSMVCKMIEERKPAPAEEGVEAGTEEGAAPFGERAEEIAAADGGEASSAADDEEANPAEKGSERANFAEKGEEEEDGTPSSER